MHRLQELVRLIRLGTGVRERARLLKMSTRTERQYRHALEEAGLLEGDPACLPEMEALRVAVEKAMPPAQPREVVSSVECWMPRIREMMANGAKPRAIWDKLQRTEPEFNASASAIKRAVIRIRREDGVQSEDVVIPVETAPGQVAQVDFGSAGRLFDPATGTIRKAWVFVMVMGYSRHMFAKLVFDQKTTTWIALHMEAFRWFGGVPDTIVPDNLKAAVIRAAFGVADRHELALNKSYRELARHYGFKIDPTPVRSPEKKGKVESGVKYVCGNFLAAGIFETVEAANADLPDWLRKTAGLRTHGTTGRRPLEDFEEKEREHLLPLPMVAYDPIEWKPATVHRDSHVEFGSRLYSVPWPNIGAGVWVKATSSSVTIYLEDQRLATHARSGPRRHSTVPEHLPEHRRDLAQRSLSYWTERAAPLGSDVATYIQHVIDSDEVLSKLRDVQAIVSHLEQFPPQRAQAACRRADYFGNYTYQGVKRILANALDLEPLPDPSAAQHGQLAEPRFARQAAELLPNTLEEVA